MSHYPYLYELVVADHRERVRHAELRVLRRKGRTSEPERRRGIGRLGSRLWFRRVTSLRFIVAPLQRNGTSPQTIGGPSNVVDIGPGERTRVAAEPRPAVAGSPVDRLPKQQCPRLEHLDVSCESGICRDAQVPVLGRCDTTTTRADGCRDSWRASVLWD